jgi:hypothetical protein
MLTTPAEIGLAVAQLRERFALGEAIWVPVRSRRDSVRQDCFKDVERQVAENGGEIIYGWQIWEWPRMMIEGEFHAVWRSPGGEIIDITIKPDGEERILFIPDPTRVYSGRQLDNIRLALWDYHLVHEYIAVLQQQYKMLDENRISEVQSLATDEYMRIESRREAIVSRLMSFPRARAIAKPKRSRRR